MPPKTSKKAAGKGKSSAVLDDLSIDVMSKEQLEAHIIHLNEELDRVREEKRNFQLENNEFQACWDNSRSRLEKKKAELRNKLSKREEAKECHRVESTKYKQKLRHVLAEHHSSVSEPKIDGLASSSLLQNQNMESELGLRRELHTLQGDFRERRIQNHIRVKELKLKHHCEVMEQSKDDNRRLNEMKMEYYRDATLMVDTMLKKWVEGVEGLDERMQRQRKTVTQDNKQAHKNFEIIFEVAQKQFEENALRVKLKEMKQQQTQASGELSAAKREQRRLRRALQEAELKRHELQERQKELSRKKRDQSKVIAMEKELRDLKLEHILLEQATYKVQQKCDNLLERQRQAFLDIQQKSSLKEVRLERKLAALTAAVEKKEVQVCAVLSATNVHQVAGIEAATRLEEIFQSKQDTIDALHRDMDRACQEYDELRLTCQEKL